MDQIQVLLNSLFTLTLTVGVSFLLYLVKSILDKYSDKLTAESQIRIQDIVNNTIAQACSFAEQWASNKTKDAESKPSSADKLFMAVEYALSDLRKHGISDYSEKNIKDKIESFLGIATMNLNSMTNAMGGMTQEGDNDEDIFGN